MGVDDTDGLDPAEPGGPVPVESADVEEAGLGEPRRALLALSLGGVLGLVLTLLARRRRARVR